MFENTTKTSKRVTGGLLAITILLTLTAVASAHSVTVQQDHAGQAAMQEMKIPQTAQDHRQHAEHYQQKAMEYRADVTAHKKMLAEYSKRIAQNSKNTLENPYLKKMRLHCEKYIRAAEALALESEEMAKFHTFRAKELDGK